MRQRTKLALVLLAVALVIGGAVVVGLERFQQGAEQQAREEAQQTANVVANQTVQSLESEVNTLQRFGTRQSTARMRTGDPDLAAFANNTDFSVVALIHRNGTIVDVQGNVDNRTRATVIGSDGLEPFMSPVVSKGKTRISDPALDDGTYFVEVAAPVNREDQVVGTVVARLDVPRFTGPVRTLNASGTTSGSVSMANGSRDTVLREATQFDRSLSASATRSQYGSTWTVTVVENRAPLDERLSQLRSLGAVSLLLVVVVVFGLGYWEYTSNLLQTERLLEGFSELRAGNYGYTLSLSAATEWERIGEGYNELTRGLAERERAIREREQQLEVLNRVLRHNLRNDMNVIIGHAEMIPELDDETAVSDAADTIVRLGEELVSHGRKARHLEAAMSEREPTSLDAVDAARSALSGVDRDGVTVETEMVESAPVVASDALELAVENLLENAIQHNDQKTPLVGLTVDTDGETVTITVADDGPGIPDHEREVLSEGVETALKHGSGVGLWLTQFVVDRSGGTLSFADRDPHGSVVTITLPVSGPDDVADDAEAHNQDDDATD